MKIHNTDVYIAWIFLIHLFSVSIFKIIQASKIRPCILIPHYFPSFTKLPLWRWHISFSISISISIFKFQFQFLIFNLNPLCYDLSVDKNNTELKFTTINRMSLTRIVYLSPDLQSTSLIGIVYVWFDRRTTALTRGSRFLCLARFPYYESRDIV